MIGSVIRRRLRRRTAVRRPQRRGPAILASQVHQIGGTLGAVSLELAPQDSYLHLAREPPDLAAADLRGSSTASWPATAASAPRSTTGSHPGGRRIIECMQSALELADEEVAVSWDVLASHGNVGTPSIFYLLKGTFEQREPGAGELGLAVTVGPGVTLGLMLLQW